MVHAFFNDPAQLEVISSTVLRVHLAPMYVDGIRLGTRSGASFQEAILAVFGGARRVVIRQDPVNICYYLVFIDFTDLRGISCLYI